MGEGSSVKTLRAADLYAAACAGGTQVTITGGGEAFVIHGTNEAIEDFANSIIAASRRAAVKPATFLLDD